MEDDDAAYGSTDLLGWPFFGMWTNLDIRMSSMSTQPRSADTLSLGADQLMLRDIIDNSPVSMAVASASGHVIYTNRIFDKEFAPDMQSSARPCLQDIIDPDDTVALLQIDRMLAGEIKKYHGEHRCKAAGGLAWVALALSVAAWDKAGRAERFVAQLTNIDRLKSVEESLAQSENRWHFALEAARQGVWDHDVRTRKMYYSPTWRTLRGFTQDEHVDDNVEIWLARVHPDDRERMATNSERQHEGEDGYDILEYRERHRDGHYVWILSRGKPVAWDADGNVVRSVGTDTDITHLKEVEAQLEAEKERWWVTLEVIADATISVELDHRVSFLNLAAQNWTGLTPDEAVGRDVSELLSLEGVDRALLEGLIQDCLTTGTTQQYDDELLFLSINGTRRDVRFSVAAVRVAHGQTLGAVIVIHDVTRSRSLQRLLKYGATHDSLTGLKNRAAFDHELERRSDVGDVDFLLFIDLDNFKPVNDTLGHAAGDALLKAVAFDIQECVRTDDTCARLGGDEFAVILRNCSKSDAARIGREILERIQNRRPENYCQMPQLGASIGLSELAYGTPPKAALAAADAACYVAKSKGRGRLEEVEVPAHDGLC